MYRHIVSAHLLATGSPVAAAINALLYPHAEVVLHDLSSGKIAAIWNAFSSRKAGDPSLLDEEQSLFNTVTMLGPYEKISDNGQKLKSVTAVLPDMNGSPAGLLCINLDISQLHQAQMLLAAFTAQQKPRPDVLLAKDWREQINLALHDWLKANRLAITALKRSDKVALVGALEAQGLFETRNAAEHLAELIGASRATIYNYLAEVRKTRSS